MNAKRLCGAYSVGTQVQGCPSIVAPAASLCGRIFTSRRKTSAACAADRATASRDTKNRNRESESEAKEYHPHTRINTLNYPSTKAGQVQSSQCGRGSVPVYKSPDCPSGPSLGSRRRPGSGGN